MTTSTQQQISDQPWVDCPDPWNLRGRLPMTPVWKETVNGAAVYRQNDGSVLYAAPPKPATPEAIARAQFVDKTYVWKEPGKETKPS